MADLREFRRVNNLTQEALGEYLGMKKSFVSKIENGKEKLPEAKFRKLISNDMGWDTSMLTTNVVNQSIGKGSHNITQVAGSSELAILQERVKYLERILEEKERTIQILMSK